MDHDRLFKELLTTFFAEFVELFLPDAAAYMERGRLEFLDKEVFTDVASSERHEVDLVVKTRFRGGTDVFFLIHVENQAAAQDGFPRRMFRYFARLHEKHALPVLPVVLFSYGKPSRQEPDRYRVDFPGFRVLDFAFRAIQLNRLNWRDYLRNPNPVASALMTKMSFKPAERPRVKLECLRMLATLKLDKARSTLISAFMEAYLKLTEAEAIVYNRELKAVERPQREAIMQLTNEWIEQGKAEGRQEGRQEFVLQLLRFRLGSIPAQMAGKVEKLSDEQLSDLGKAILGFQELRDARRWFAEVLEKKG
jgi:hypothetical protein